MRVLVVLGRCPEKRDSLGLVRIKDLVVGNGKEYLLT